MRHRRRFPRPAWPKRSTLILVSGLALGVIAAIHVVALIRDARSSGMFGPPPVVAVEPVDAQRAEEDPAMDAALAAAVGARHPEDCRALAPRYRRGCLDYVAGLRAEPVPNAVGGPGPAIAPSAPTR